MDEKPELSSNIDSSIFNENIQQIKNSFNGTNIYIDNDEKSFLSN